MALEVEKIAAVLTDDGAASQVLLAAVIANWRSAGAEIVGLIGELHGLPDRTCGAGFLRDIAFGKPYSIYLETPPSQTSCHLDQAGVTCACKAILQQIPTSELVVLNKFGKLESMGEGLATAFKLAIAAGKPLLTTVSRRHRDAWCAFAPDTIFLPSDKASLDNWWSALPTERRHPDYQHHRHTHAGQK